MIKIRYVIKNLTFLVRYPNFRSVYLGFSRMRRFSTRYHNISLNETNWLLKKVVFLQFRKGHTYSAHVAMGGGGALKCVHSKSKGPYLITMTCRGVRKRPKTACALNVWPLMQFKYWNLIPTLPLSFLDTARFAPSRLTPAPQGASIWRVHPKLTPT